MGVDVIVGVGVGVDVSVGVGVGVDVGIEVGVAFVETPAIFLGAVGC